MNLVELKRENEVEDFGAVISDDLKPSKQCREVVLKAN